MKNLKHLLILSLIVTLFNTSGVMAQETEETEAAPSFNFSGTVDTYFRTSFSEDPVAPGTSFANLNGFALGMANFIVSYEGEKSGFVADVVFGPRGSDAVFGSVGNSSELVNQLYAYYDIAEGVRITLGNFNTFLGYEVISPAANFNYSTSFMFSYGPFSHTGVKADFTLADDISLMLGVFNQTDQTEANYDRYTAFGAQLGLYGQYINLLAGEDYFQLDYTGGFDIADSFFLGINATTATLAGDTGFAGVALYPQLTTSDTFAIGLRGEFFSETDGFGALVDDGDADNFSLTLTGSFTSGNFTFKPEFRIDSASSEIFAISPTETADSLSSFVVAAIYSF
ncbi:MAG: outer membrane beta-barrel protein [Flavobacteriaceae bacterium]|nr:outer membrane beta-barrel protein [Flavobacteriaceae bacterium]MDG2503194.1 outer membrane beta-barrel protein [Flavobacteriaceae bacterium]